MVQWMAGTVMQHRTLPMTWVWAHWQEWNNPCRTKPLPTDFQTASWCCFQEHWVLQTWPLLAGPCSWTRLLSRHRCCLLPSAPTWKLNWRNYQNRCCGIFLDIIWMPCTTAKCTDVFEIPTVLTVPCNLHIAKRKLAGEISVLAFSL